MKNKLVYLLLCVMLMSNCSRVSEPDAGESASKSDKSEQRDSEMNIKSEKVHPVYAITCKEDDWVSRVKKSGGTIIASTTLKPQGKHNYNAVNVLDKDLSTCWCPEGDGINEFIILRVPFGAKGIRIVNGLSKNNDLYYANNRVKMIHLQIIFKNPEEWLENSYDMCGKTKYTSGNITLRGQEITLEDKLNAQEIIWKKDLWDFPQEIKASEYYLVIGILDIYKGSKYNDTCISAIEIIE